LKRSALEVVDMMLAFTISVKAVEYERRINRMCGPHENLDDSQFNESNDVIDRESDLTDEELDEYLRDVPPEADLINQNEANDYYAEGDDPTVLDMEENEDEDEDEDG
jgi:hypothetical protein